MGLIIKHFPNLIGNAYSTELPDPIFPFELKWIFIIDIMWETSIM